MATLKVTNIKNESFNGDQLYLKTDGTVGVGTNSPGKQVHLQAATPFLRLEDNTAASKRLDLWVESSDGFIGTNQSSQELHFQTTGTTRLTITSGGDVSIPVDSKKFLAGAGNDVRMFHDGSDGYFDSITGNLYVYNHASGNLDFGTAGVTRLRIDSSGNVNFGAEKAVALPSGTGIQVYNSSAPRIKLVNDTTGNASGDGFQLYLSGSGVILDQKESAEIRFYTGGTEKTRIDSSGRVLQGITSARGNFGNNTSGVEVAQQLEGTSYITSTMSIIRNSNDANDGGIIIGKTRATSVGGNTVVQASDYLGEIMWAGSDGTTLLEGARIDAVVASGVGNDDMPTALRFLTNVGSTSPVERLRITHNGDLVTSGLTEPIGFGYHGTNARTISIYSSSDNAGVIELAGSKNINGYNAGSIAFVNNDNANGSTPWDSQSKFVALLRAQLVTSDNNAGDDSGADLVLYRKPEAEAGTESVRFKSTGDVNIVNGNLVVADGHGIDFSATSGTGTSELFDDYEEGTWTPNFDNIAAPTYGSQSGRYTKVGRYVYCTGIITVSSGLDTTDGSTIAVAGLPFTGNTDGEVCLFTMGRYTSLLPQAALDDYTSCRFGGTYLMLMNANNSGVQYNHCNSSGMFSFSFCYQL